MEFAPVPAPVYSPALQPYSGTQIHGYSSNSASGYQTSAPTGYTSGGFVNLADNSSVLGRRGTASDSNDAYLADIQGYTL